MAARKIINIIVAYINKNFINIKVEARLMRYSKFNDNEV